MENTVELQGDWRAVGRQVGRARMFGEGHGMVEYRKVARRGCSEVVRRERIGSRTSDRCASEYSPSALSARQAQHTILFDLGGVRQFIFLSVFLDFDTSLLPREEKHPKQGVQYKGCTDAPELGSAVQRSTLLSTASTEARGGVSGIRNWVKVRALSAFCGLLRDAQTGGCFGSVA